MPCPPGWRRRRLRQRRALRDQYLGRELPRRDLVISPSTKPGTRSGTLFNHYSLLGTAEQLLGLSKLGLAASSATMIKAFNL
jgi:hypothetical protein